MPPKRQNVESFYRKMINTFMVPIKNSDQRTKGKENKVQSVVLRRVLRKSLLVKFFFF